MLYFINKLFILILFSLIFANCSCTGFGVSEEEEMQTLASSLTKLSASVEATVRYEQISTSITDEELLKLSTKHVPDLLSSFSIYKIKVMKHNKHAVVLICTKDTHKALLEDAGCSAKMDKHLWKNSKNDTCDFTLSVNKVCI